MNADGPVLLEIVVPAHNEAARLPRGLAELSAALRRLDVPAEVIVVDNASDDATPAIAREWAGPVPVRLLGCARRGKGAAVRAGLLATRAPYVGFCDADMATGLAALGQVLELLRAGDPVVVGSRRHPDSRVEDYSSPLRKLGAITFNRLIRDLAGGVTDTQCGFKFFAGPLARAAAADLRTTGFAFDAELLMQCARRGAAVTDVPVEWRDVPGSTFSVRRHSVACLCDLARIRALTWRAASEPAASAAPTSTASASADGADGAREGRARAMPLAVTETSGSGP
ncbi:glycosyltransferase [Actinomadura xylanilytica]|uniref:glycosyltransferase n=1 Tax=Actinomadura xylanilytica TaxID=887459 RepID=UPI00255B35DD|nr:glycosyltransferase [Actinomadura xylanilytica]MDL4775966.1 glycosyltransferase [Actinomadura xylanilytica]